jgi:glycerophosphoryl diester phosphodiesterase
MKILGHRGARFEAPENTLRGLEVALRAGVDGVEVDVHLTRDGRPVVIHDETVERTCKGASGRVDALTLDELRRLDAGDGERVPTLEEVLEVTRGRCELFVELKGPGCEAAVVRAVSDLGLTDACLLKAFDHRQVLRAKALAPDLRGACLLVARPVDPVGLARAARADGLSLNLAYVDAELVDACHAAGLLVCGWNCNRPEELPRWRATGLDWLGTDTPTTFVPEARRSS